MNEDRRRGVALVTGAGKRLGRAIALDLAGHGFDVAVHYHRSADEAAAVVREARALGRQACALDADLADEDRTRGLVGRAADALGTVTTLVNSAAIFEFDRPETARRDGWERHLAINLRAPLVLTQALLEQLPPQAQGNVVNIIDQRVLNPTPNFTSYTVSKCALFRLTQHLAVELAPRLRVNGVGPGPVLPAPGMSDAAFRRIVDVLPLAQAPTPEQIVATVRFLVDNAAVTGQMIAVDAGQHLGWLLPGQAAGGGA